MATYINEDGPYLLEQMSNADVRRRQDDSASAWADELVVAPNGRYAYAVSPLAPAWKYTMLFLPHCGPGEPRPQS